MATLSRAAAHHRARIGALSRSRSHDDPELLEAKRGLIEAQAANYIARVLAAAPPLTDEQRARLAELFRPANAAGELTDAAEAARLSGGMQ